jgi:hypothetical protein
MDNVNCGSNKINEKHKLKITSNSKKIKAIAWRCTWFPKNAAKANNVKPFK